jgi:uncharacterized protein (TIGR02652 family)
MNLALQYPIFGPEISCPHCRQTIPALTLTDTYLCSRHGAFEADPETEELIHLPSGRRWRYWQDQWYRQHTHPDGIRFEIHEALDRLYTEGYRATKVVIASRYRDLVSSYLERSHPWRENGDFKSPKLYGLPISFSSESLEEPCWQIINFSLEKEPGVPRHYPYRFLFE